MIVINTLIPKGWFFDKKTVFRLNKLYHRATLTRIRTCCVWGELSKKTLRAIFITAAPQVTFRTSIETRYWPVADEKTFLKQTLSYDSHWWMSDSLGGALSH